MRIEIKDYQDKWQVIKDATMTTISKDTGSYPTSEWKKKLLMSEHSPIRIGNITFKLYDIQSFVSGHLVRHHIGCEKFVSSRRSDRYNSNEPITRESLVDLTMNCNFQALINISRKRLCNCASKETREAWQMVKDEIAKVEPEVASCMVKECVYRNGLCPEMFSCGYHKTEAFKKELEEYRGGMNE